MTMVHCLGCAERIPATAPHCPSCGAPQDDLAQPADPGTLWDSVEQRLRAATADKYEIRGLLGYGGMAAVYLALDPKLNRFVAIKVMSPALMTDRGMIQRFTTEAITIARMRHPNIVTIFDVDDRDGLHFFVMSYIAGRSLESILVEQERIDVGVATHWLRQVGDALAYAHDQGIVHRDVKPGNILIDESGQALVADFGIAKVADEDGLTRLGTIVGTPAYMSPEQYTGVGATSKSDQWSLGAVGYEMLTGAPPIKGSIQSIASAHASGWTAPPLHARCEGCPEQLTAVIQRMLARDPDARWTSMHEVGTALGVPPTDRRDPVYAAAKDLVTGRAVVSIQVSRLPARLPEGGEAMLEVRPVDRHGVVIRGRHVTVRSTDPSVANVSVGGVVNARGAGRTMLVARSGAASVAVPLEVTASEKRPAPDVSSHPTVLANELGSTGAGAGALPPAGRTVRVPEADLPAAPRLAPRPSSRARPARARARRAGLPRHAGRWVAVLGLVGLGVFVGLRLGSGTPSARPGTTSATGGAPDAPGGPATGNDERQGTDPGAAPVPDDPEAAVPETSEPPEQASPPPQRPASEPQRPRVSSVIVALAADTMQVGDQVAIEATVTGADGRALLDSQPRWSVDDAGVARIDRRGSSTFVVAVAPGETALRADVDGVTGRARLVVREGVTALVLSAERRTLVAGETLRIEVTDQAGRPVSVALESSDTSVATVSELGLVEGRSTGRVTVTASGLGFSAYADLTVEPAPVAPGSQTAVAPASLVDPDRTYGPTEITERPVLVNEAEYAQAVDERFPLMLRDAGVGGNVRLELTIDRDGSVLAARLAEPGGSREVLETAALEVGRLLRFRPARRFGMDVRTTGFEFLVTFDPGG